MKLNANETLWAPRNQPRYLLVLPRNQRPPRTRQEFLDLHAALLARLVDEAEDRELEEAGTHLENNLEPEVLDWLPDQRFKDPKTAPLLHSLPLVEGSPLHEWKTEVDAALREPAMPEEEAQREVESLTLPGRLNQMLQA